MVRKRLLRESLFLLAALVGLCLLGGRNQKPASSNPDMLCGYRSVQFVAAEYSKNIELIDVIRRMSRHTIAEPISLREMSHFLGELGIETKLVRLQSGHVLSWPYPAIAHLSPASKRDDGVGHFVVCLPNESNNSEVIFYNGLSGLEEGSTEEFSNAASGAYLLSAPTKFDLSTELFSVKARHKWWGLLGEFWLTYYLCVIWLFVRFY